MKTVSIENKKVFHDYYVEETLECGIELWGNEVKSLRSGKASIKESWISIEKGELVIKKMQITPWETSNKFDVDALRDKKLLAHKKEILNFKRKTEQQGYTIVPVKVYFDKNGRVKVLVGLAKGKHNYDKRRCEKEKQVKTDIARAMKAANS